MAVKAPEGHPDKMDVIVIGGSVAGLMHGIMFKSLGHNVRILEQQESSRVDYGAGIGIGARGKKFLEEFDVTGTTLAYDCPGFRFLGLRNEIVALTALPMFLTSWTALYYRLRGLFDGISSPFCLESPSAPSGYGTAVFDTKKRVISVVPASDSLLTVNYEDMDGADHRIRTSRAHLVIDASGPYSLVRSTLVPEASKPSYTGFVAWRGTVPESQVSEETSNLFDTWFNVFPMAGGNYCVGYAVPGKNGSLEPGQKLLNWVWYTTVVDRGQLKAILTDTDGHTHSNSIPRGKLNMSEWIKWRDAVIPSVNKAFAELMLNTEEPFVSTIRESFAGRRSFFDGRLLLVGDCSNLMIPNGGQSTNNAATQCLELRNVLQGKTTLQEWETSVLNQGWQMRLFSHTIANRFLYGSFWAFVASLRLGWFLRWLRLKTFMKRVLRR